MARFLIEYDHFVETDFIRAIVAAGKFTLEFRRTGKGKWEHFATHIPPEYSDHLEEDYGHAKGEKQVNFYEG